MKGKLSLKHKVMLAGLVVAFLVVLGAGPYLAHGQIPNEPPPPTGKVKFFDPFTLTTIYVDAPQILANPSGDSPSGSGTASPAGVTTRNLGAAISGGVIVQSPILIPQNRPPRSPCKPPKPPKPPK